MKNLLTLVASASTALAHGGVLTYNIGGKIYNGFVPYNTPTGQNTIQREWDSYNPIQDPTSSGMTCNLNGAVANEIATVAAGSKIVSYWTNPWPHTIGPMVTWMANCNGDCASFTGTGKVWFKIDQAGLISGTLATGLWGSGEMVNNNSTWTSTIPANLKAGNYLLRTETMAIHTSNAPQWYPECATLTVTGSGTGVPASSYLAAIPGVYSMSDPEVNIDIYSNANAGVTTYTIPGPPVYTG
ncbi:lytic polysaccharide monooxygenase [Viridothelium virens]|uniref:AA9 family lytic polysaccharide monooxygenase n=1 Tax=Viridothelium virens TaxID=1048519 RepID=A0A6A6H129_VIRVR|nr:lytic polysaccharide monooxygenase [Viridothelium virens]